MASNVDESVDAFAGCNLFTYTDTMYHQQSTQRSLNLRRQKNFTDFTLRCGAKQAPCHRIILASGSPFFYELLTSGQARDFAEIPALSPTCFDTVLDYIYTTEITIDDRYVKELVTACEHLQLKSLKKACDEHLSETVHPRNCMGLYMFAWKFELEQTKVKSKGILLNQVDDLLKFAQTDEFKSLGEDVLIEWISDDKLDVEDESQVFELVEKWVTADPSRDNEACIAKVLQHVRLALCDTEYIVHTVQRSPLMEYSECQKLLNEAKDFALLSFAQKDTSGMESESTRPRTAQIPKWLFMVGGGNTCWQLENMKDWKHLDSLPKNQQRYSYNMGACVIGHEVILTGGASDIYGAMTRTSNAWAYYTLNNTWTALPSMSQPRSSHGVATDGNTVYVMGGYNGRSLTSVEMLDCTRQKWSSLQPMKYAARYNYGFFIAGNVYAVSPDRKKTQCYQVARETWTVKTDVPNGPDYMSCATSFSDFIYVAGRQTCLCYDTAYDQWTELSPPIHNHGWASLVDYEDKLYLCGGKLRLMIEEYDVAMDQWTVSDIQMPTVLMGHCVLAVK